MLTVAEAMQRAAVNELIIRRSYNASNEWCVTLREDKGDDAAYYTDDLEDAILTGAAMRAKRRAQVLNSYRL